jgi:hypothetical protein
VKALRYQLGAEELIELGIDGSKVILKNRKPFLAGRIVRLGSPEENILDTLAMVGKFVAERLALALDTLSRILNVPLGVISESVDVASMVVSDLLKKVPSIGNLLAEILLLGGALMKFGLSIPGLVLGGLACLLAGIAKAMDGRSDTQAQIDTAKESILNQASEDLKDRVEKIIGTIGISEDNLAPDVTVSGQPLTTPAGTSLSGAPPPPAPGASNAWAVGVPVVGAVALVTALAMK